jgi:hypothetical protein
MRQVRFRSRRAAASRKSDLQLAMNQSYRRNRISSEILCDEACRKLNVHSSPLASALAEPDQHSAAIPAQPLNRIAFTDRTG